MSTYSFIPGDIPDSGLPSYQSQSPSLGGTNPRPNQIETRPISGDNKRPSFGTGSDSSRPGSGFGSFQPGGRPVLTGNTISGESRPSFGGGLSGSKPRPSFGAGLGGSPPRFSGGSRPSFGASSSKSRPSQAGGSSGSRTSSTSGTTGVGGGSGSQGTFEATASNNFGFPKSLGKAGIDFPIYDRMAMPLTSFSCQDKENGGYV